MTKAAALGDEDAGGHRVIDALGPHEAEHRHQLLVHERVHCELAEVARQRGDEHLHVVRGIDACLAGQDPGRLAERLGVDDVVAAEDEVAQSLDLVGFEHLGSHPLELGDDRVVDLGVDDAGLLGGADHRGVEGLGDQDVDDGHRDVGAAVHVDGRVARPHADRRLAGAVGEGHDLRAAGRPDEVDARGDGRGDG